MTRDDMIKMAQEAGIVVTGEAVWKLCEMFASAEREACAELAFNAKTYLEAAAAIRARGQP